MIAMSHFIELMKKWDMKMSTQEGYALDLHWV